MRDHERSLRAATTLALEELGLVCVGRALPSSTPAGELTAAARLYFTGARDGHLTLLVTDDVFRALAENMLGVEGERAAAWRWDALGEMANVVCGNVLPMVLGASARLVFAPPVNVAADTVVCGPHATQVDVEVESGRARAVLELHDAAEARPGSTR